MSGICCSLKEVAIGEARFSVKVYTCSLLLQVNLERSDTKEKLKFLHSVLAPFFEAYFVTAHHIGEVIDNEQPGEILIHVVIYFKKWVNCSYELFLLQIT